MEEILFAVYASNSIYNGLLNKVFHLSLPRSGAVSCGHSSMQYGSLLLANMIRYLNVTLFKTI